LLNEERRSSARKNSVATASTDYTTM